MGGFAKGVTWPMALAGIGVGVGRLLPDWQNGASLATHGIEQYVAAIDACLSVGQVGNCLDAPLSVTVTVGNGTVDASLAGTYTRR